MEFESLFIEVTYNSHSITVGEIYRVPNSNGLLSIQRYEALLDKLNHAGNDVILGTDQNFNLLNIDSHSNTRNLFDMFIANGYGYTPTIFLPTRVTHSTSSLIDNIYVKTKTPSIRSGVLNVDLSDHFPVMVSVGGSKPASNITKTTIKYRILDDCAHECNMH